MDVVEVDYTVGRQAIVGGGQYELRNKISTRPGENGHDDGLDPVSNRISGQDENGPVATESCGEPDLTPSHRPSPPSPLLVPSPQFEPLTARNQLVAFAPSSGRRPHCGA
jgi:hypothetical protein